MDPEDLVVAEQMQRETRHGRAVVSRVSSD